MDFGGVSEEGSRHQRGLLWIVAQPQPGELADVGPHQVPHLGDDDVLVAVVHSRACPVEGAGDEPPAVHHCKLVMHADGRPVETHADPCWAESKGGGEGGVGSRVRAAFSHSDAPWPF